MNIDFDRITLSPWFAAGLGSLVALKFAPGLGWIDRLVNVAAGCLIAGFLSPAAAAWLHISAPGMQSGLAFVVGLFGLSLGAACTQGIRDLKVGEIIASWTTRK